MGIYGEYTYEKSKANLYTAFMQKGDIMLRGASQINLDTKGRLAVPTRYRSQIMDENDGQMICTVDIRQPCLLLYPLNEWDKVEKKLLMLSNFDPEQRRLQRVMLGYATECSLDKSGRILLSQPLRNHAKLDKSLMLVGQLNKFEVWNSEQWEKQILEDIEVGSGQQFGLSDELKALSL